MKRDDILENLCFHDKRNPAYYPYGDLVDTKSKDKNCNCDNCNYSNCSQLAVITLGIIGCQSCRLQHECIVANKEKCRDAFIGDFNKWESK